MIVNDLRVEDICDFIGGSQPAKSEFINEPKPGYVRLIQTRDYKTDAFPTYIPENSTRKFCDEQDVMIGRYGPPIFQICRGLKGAYNVALLKAKPKKGIDREFLYYFLKQDAVFQYVEKLSPRTGGQTGVDIASLYKYPVRVPSEIEDQSRLVASLVAIDKKIELNNRINAELEAMAKTLYDYWFVQFDFPDANGKPYKTSGGQMVYNHALKREIPEGWEDSTIGATEPNIVTGKTPSKDNPEYFGGNVPFITIGDIRGNTYVVSTEETLTEQGASTQKNKFLPEDSICVTCIASPGLVGFVTSPAQTNQQINSIACSNEANKYYLFFAIKSYFDGAKAKTGNTFANMNKGDFSSIGILKPSSQVLQLYHKNVYPLFQQIKSKSLEIQQLVRLRDWLLPMLMNGQVTVK